MSGWLENALAALAASPAVQGLLAGLATFVLEDPVTVTCGLMVAAGAMAFATALIGVSAGIAAGDIGLYGIGRMLGPQIIGRGPFTEPRIERASSWLRQNLVLAMVMARFVPGMRLPTYVASGVLNAPLTRFVGIAVAASLVWTLILLRITIVFGEQVLPLLGNLRWPVAITFVCGLFVVQRVMARKMTRDVPQRSASAPVLSSFELWPAWLFYIPVAGYWLWLALRHRSLSLPTAANPAIYSGGFIGERKSEILDLVAPAHRDLMARWLVLERPIGASRQAVLQLAEGAMQRARLEYPVVAKPDVGQRGDGVRPISDREELGSYLDGFPEGRRVLLQEMVGVPCRHGLVSAGEIELDDVHEAGVFYWRRPGTDHGEFFSITLKLFPYVVGDGVHTLRELIARDPRAKRLANIYVPRFEDRIDSIVESGVKLSLVFAGNHCQGAIFRDGTHLATHALRSRLDEIARSMGEFYFGRFDIRFAALDDLLAGGPFKIIEINGASAEATHIWDASTELGDAYRTLFSQLKTLFEIGAANRARGHRPLGVRQLVRDVIGYRRLARRYPETR